MLEESEIKRVESIPIIEGIEPSAKALYPLLKKAAENPVELATDFNAYWNMLVIFMNDDESIILSAGLPKNYVLVSYQDGINT